MKAPELYRVTDHPNPMFNTDASDGANGMFQVPVENGEIAVVLSTSGEYTGWEHVSARIVINKEGDCRIPTWDEMCMIKDLFWDKEERVVQYHPPASEYINDHPYVLHLWRHISVEIPHPPTLLVGKKLKYS